jgi:O-antigen ligase
MPDNLYTKDYEPVRPSRRGRFAARNEEGDDAQDDANSTGQRISSNRFAPERESASDAIGELWSDWNARDHVSNQTEIPTIQTASASPGEPPAKAKEWLCRRGHTITFAGLFLFTLVLLTRPSDWYPNAFTASLAFFLGVSTLGVFAATQLVREGNLTTRQREVYLALALLLAGILSIPFADQSRDDALATFMENFVRAVLMFIVIVNVVRTERRLRWMMMLSMGVGVFLAGSALRDYATGNLAVEGYRVSGALQGMFGNPNDLSQYLVAMVPIAVALLCVARGVLRRIFYALCIATLVGGVVVTFSRGGSIALTVIVFVLTWKLGKRHRALFITLVLVGYIGFLAAAPGGYRTRLLSIYDNNLEVAGGSAAARRDLLKESVKVALRHPVLGIGMGNFRLIYKLQTHNSYTQVASEMGMFGFFAYLLFIITPLKRLKEIERATNGDPQQRRFYFLAIGLQAALIGYMFSSFFGAVAYYFNVYYLVGYAVSLRMIYYHLIKIPVDATALPQAANKKTNMRRPQFSDSVTGIAPQLPAGLERR